MIQLACPASGVSSTCRPASAASSVLANAPALAEPSVTIATRTASGLPASCSPAAIAVQANAVNSNKTQQKTRFIGFVDNTGMSGPFRRSLCLF